MPSTSGPCPRHSATSLSTVPSPTVSRLVAARAFLSEGCVPAGASQAPTLTLTFFGIIQEQHRIESLGLHLMYEWSDFICSLTLT